MIFTVSFLACLFEAEPTVSPCPSDMSFVKVPNNQISWGEIHPSQSWHLPQQQQFMHSFCMDRYEYPNQFGVSPLTKVTWEQARAYCEKKNKRLCWESEWEFACRGSEKRLYSYGKERKKGYCYTDFLHADTSIVMMPSGSFSTCRNPEGIYDLNGNVSEWVADDWRAFDHNQGRWKPNKQNHKTLRGGTAWRTTHYGQDCTSRHSHHRSQWSNRDDGFRCCKEASSQ